MEDNAKRLAALFISNTSSFGRYPAKGSPSTDKGQYQLKHFELHLQGKMGLGLVPITNNNDCYWGAIDIDCHGADEGEINLSDLYDKANSFALPVTICRSKSGGAHVYVFSSEPIEAKTMRSILKAYAVKLGFGSSEIFPKQNTVVGPKGEERLGNWINLPYFKAEDTNRYCWLGKPVSLEFFLEHAEAHRLTQKELNDAATGDHSEAPPCIQQMMYGKLPNGYRNEGMFAISTYMKKAFPEDWKHRVMDVNTISLETPLASKEIETIIGSVGRREYKYRCQQEPCKSFCQAKICLTRKFGIEESESPQRSEEAGLVWMNIEAITKVETDPPTYFVTANGRKLRVSATQLSSPVSMHVAMLEQTNLVTYPVKPKDWLEMLATAMKSLVIEAAPDEASPSGLIRTRLMAFANKATSDNREHILHGMPVRVVGRDGEVKVYFKGESFVDFLRKTKSSDLRLGPEMWAALRKVGVESERFRVNKDKIVQVWSVKLATEDHKTYDDHNFQSEM